MSILPVIDESCNIPMFSCINKATWHHPTDPLSGTINMGTDVINIATAIRVISENNGESA